jgi:polyisoprenyl-phosphate glycosyltransferase
VTPATDPPARLPEMIERCRAGAGIVSGTRLERKGEPLLLRLGARVFYSLANRVFHLDIPLNSTHFKVLSRQAVNAVIQVRDRNRFLRTLGSQIGFASGTFPYDTIARRAAPRRKTVRQGLWLAANIIVTNSVQPLYLAARIGLVVVMANAVFLLYVIAIYTFKADVAAGWTTGSAVMATMFGTLALMGTIGLIYLARLVDERSDRPLYFVLSERSGVAPDLDRHRNVVADSEGRQ